MSSISDHGAGGRRDAGDWRRYVLHITSVDRWRSQQADGRGFRDPSLDQEGFIHCSTVDQLLIPANERFAGRDDLVLLVVDTDRLHTELVYEDCYESGTRFPHVYGPISLSAVVEVIDFPPDADGGFSLPGDLSRFMTAASATQQKTDGGRVGG